MKQYLPYLILSFIFGYTLGVIVGSYGVYKAIPKEDKCLQKSVYLEI